MQDFSAQNSQTCRCNVLIRNIACEVVRIEELGSHDMFIANVKGVYADEAYMDEKGKFDLIKAKPIVYSHGQYIPGSL